MNFASLESPWPLSPHCPLAKHTRLCPRLLVRKAGPTSACASPGGPTMTSAPTAEPSESEPVPFPERLDQNGADDNELDVEDVQAIQEQLGDIASAPVVVRDYTEASLYYDASSMAPLSPLAAVSTLSPKHYLSSPTMILLPLSTGRRRVHTHDADDPLSPPLLGCHCPSTSLQTTALPVLGYPPGPEACRRPHPALHRSMG